MTDKKPHCIECGRTEDDVLYFAPHMDRPCPVKFTKSRYGLLCQRHMQNAYDRTTRQRKSEAKRLAAQIEDDAATGQKRMFD